MKKIEPLIAKNLALKKDRTLSSGDPTRTIVDATKINAQRPRKNQRDHYSGKKKRRAQKIETQINEKGRIICVSKAYGGRKHDFAKIRKTDASGRLIENVFARLKKFKILSSVYRNFQKKLRMRFNIIAP